MTYTQLQGQPQTQDICHGVGSPAQPRPGACAAVLGASIDESVADALDLAYCDECKASWRVLGGWCDADDERAWYEARGLHAPSRIVRCHGVASHGARCRVNSLCPHAGADPLRTGARFCAVHSES